MSIVDDQIRRLDSLLDRYSIAYTSSQQSTTTDHNAHHEGAPVGHTDGGDTATSARLKVAIRSLSTTSGSRPLLKRRVLRRLIKDIRQSHHQSHLHDRDEVAQADIGQHDELLWIATGKATVQLYGIILNSLLEQTIPLNESIWYWDDVLGSYIGTGLYMLQTSPLRFWNAGREVYREARTRYDSKVSIRETAADSRQGLSQSWRQFYGLVRDSIRDRSLAQARVRILSPFALSRTEARKKQQNLKRLQEQSATAIGLLVDEGLRLPSPDYDGQTLDVDWKESISRSVAILESILHHSHTVDTTVTDYEFHVIEGFNSAEYDFPPAQLAEKLLHILDTHLPQQENSWRLMAFNYGKPSRWIRYWIPGVVLLLSGSTLLRIFANRRAEIVTWFQELGQTSVDFWYNWVVEPTRKLVGTIRHDETSEVAIMSRDSLRSDRDSLERMVVDFAVAHPDGGRAYTEPEIADIRSKVREGDLTPVLRVYEQDMKSPVVKAVTGNLIQALLIQIQKTKVDVEVAIGGIDSLLKSQELLFGFVGVAPGILLSYFLAQWLRGVLSGRKGVDQGKRKGETIRLLRNVDRTLLNAVPTENNILSFKDHGLLICEVQVLRQRAAAILPGTVLREFLEDLDDLLNIHTGVDRQMKVVERIHWAYSRWLR